MWISDDPMDLYDLRRIVKGYIESLGKNVKKFKENMPGYDFAKESESNTDSIGPNDDLAAELEKSDESELEVLSVHDKENEDVNDQECVEKFGKKFQNVKPNVKPVNANYIEAGDWLLVSFKSESNTDSIGPNDDLAAELEKSDESELEVLSVHDKENEDVNDQECVEKFGKKFQNVKPVNANYIEAGDWLLVSFSPENKRACLSKMLYLCVILLTLTLR
ncbi:hypothetical protein QE152_g26565 [Popillia japonica]|uniref:Uncharacterized protein n=1 Tax=Popillia japonica TaxID=7064 RepID=A0AAW1JXV5_POPJA